MTVSAHLPTTTNDKEVAEQLEILSERIYQGIKKANQVVQKAEQIQKEIEEFSPTANKAISVGEQIQNWEQVLNQVAEIADKETIHRLEREIELATNKLDEVQAQVKQTDKIFDGFMSELQKRLVEVSRLKEQIQQDKTMVQDLTTQSDIKYQKILQLVSEINKKQPSPVACITDENLSTSNNGRTIIEDLLSDLDYHVQLDQKKLILTRLKKIPQ